MSVLPQNETNALKPGFQNPVLDATDCFRNIMEAMAKPALKQPLLINLEAPATLHSGSAQILLTLLDYDSKLYLCPELDHADLRDWVLFHTGCPLTDNPQEADFALMLPESDPNQYQRFQNGTAEYPDRSTTIVLQVTGLTDGKGMICSGPGFQSARTFGFDEANDALWKAIADSRLVYPRGLDWIFAAPDSLATLPRSTKLEALSCM